MTSILNSAAGCVLFVLALTMAAGVAAQSRVKPIVPHAPTSAQCAKLIKDSVAHGDATGHTVPPELLKQCAAPKPPVCKPFNSKGMLDDMQLATKLDAELKSGQCGKGLACTPAQQATIKQTIQSISQSIAAQHAAQVACSGPAPAPPSVIVRGLEVTQAIQDMIHDVPLVAAKTTWVRVYFDTTIDSPTPVSGILQVTTLADNATLYIPSAGPLTVAQGTSLRAARETWPLSMNFLVPANLTAAGKVSFSIVGVSSPGPYADCVNCGTGRTVTFVPAPPLRVRLVGLQYVWGTPPATQAPRPIDYTLLTSWLARAYPTAQILSSQTTVVANPGLAVVGSAWSCNVANVQVAAFRANEVATGTDPRTHYLGLVVVVPSDGATYMRGCASGVPLSPAPSTVASGPVGDPTWAASPVNAAGDTDGSFADWYGGHELAHTFGRLHPGFCNGNTANDPSFPYPNGQISDNLGSYTGLDVGDATNVIPLTVLPGGSRFDIMTYCNQPVWPSAYAYEGVLTRLTAEDPSFSGPTGGGGGGGGAAGGAPGANSLPYASMLLVGPVVNVVAIANLTKRTGTILYITPLGAVAPQPKSMPNAELVALSQDGRELGRYPAALREDSDTPAGADRMALVDASVPVTPALATIQLVVSRQAVASFSASQNTPPAPAKIGFLASVGSEANVLTWTVDRAAVAERITYTVEISREGKTWETIAIGLVEPRLRLSADQAASALIRVTATNGFVSSQPTVRAVER